MSQFPGDPKNPYQGHQQPAYPQQPVYYQGPPRTSGLAVGAFVCSMILCCPLTTIPGIILGIVGATTIGKNPMVRGKGLAIAAIIIGLIGTALQGVVGWGYGSMVIGLLNLVNTDADAAVRAAADGDYQGFRSIFTSAGQGASDAEVEQFITDLEARFGAYRSLTLDDQHADFMQQQSSDEFVVPVIMDFENQTVDGTIVVKWIPLTDFQISSIEVHDGGETISFP